MKKQGRTRTSALLSGMKANTVAQFSNILMQVAGVPFFLSFWTPVQYGTWLILLAATGYLSLCDFGSVGVAASRVSIAVANRKWDEAQSIFSTTIYLTAAGGAIAGVIAIVIFYTVGSKYFPEYANNFGALTLLTIAAIASPYASISDVAYRAFGQYARGLNIATASRLGEWLFTLAAVACFQTILAAAIATTAFRIASLIVVWRDCRARCNKLSWKLRRPSVEGAMGLARAGASFLTFPFSNLLCFQGTSVLVGALAGPIALAQFNALRTLSRVFSQGVVIVAHSAWPEISRAKGTGNSPLLFSLYKRVLGSAAIITLIGAAASYIVGMHLFVTWTGGKIEYNDKLYLTLLCAAAFGSIAHATRVSLLAIDRYGKLSIAYLLASFVAVGAFALIMLLSRSVQTATYAMVAFEAFTLLVGLQLCSKAFRGPVSIPTHLKG